MISMRWEKEPARVPKLYADDSVHVVFRHVATDHIGMRCVEYEGVARTMDQAVEAWFRARPCLNWTIADAICDLTGYRAANDRSSGKVVDFGGPHHWYCDERPPAVYNGNHGEYFYRRDVVAAYMRRAERCVVCGTRLVNRKHRDNDCPEPCWSPPRNLTRTEVRKFEVLHYQSLQSTCSTACHFAMTRIIRHELREIRDTRLTVTAFDGRVRDARKMVRTKMEAAVDKKSPTRTRIQTWTSMRSRLGRSRSRGSTLLPAS